MLENPVFEVRFYSVGVPVKVTLFNLFEGETLDVLEVLDKVVSHLVDLV
jgi:hypothetical protein